MADSFSTKFEEFFRQHLRRFFDARRTLECVSRLALHTRPPHTMPPSQWLPQRIGTTLHREQTVVVAQLYLSTNETLGGMSFFFPKRTVRETFNVINDSYALDSAAFEAKHRLRADDARESNDLFHLAQTIPAKFNRMVIFDGAMFHSPQITSETPLVSDPHNGRLTFDAYLTCKRHSDGTADRRRT
ncbi:MAG: hypothetical protein EAZ24_16790 [Burkholderiales bacterium]|nr:MAG: hypothetical protein EAZ24_16790 [Burkholderiales bacterium]